MDLSRIDIKAASEKGAVLDLKHPMTGEETGVKITVIGRDSPSVSDVMDAIEKRKASGEKFTRDQEGIELLVAVTKGWENLEFDGKPLEFSADSARKLYADPRTEWIAEQVGPFALRRRNFAGNLPKG